MTQKGLVGALAPAVVDLNVLLGREVRVGRYYPDHKGRAFAGALLVMYALNLKKKASINGRSTSTKLSW